MDKYINATKMIKDIRCALTIKEAEGYSEDNTAHYAFQQFIRMLEQETAADVQEVRHGKWGEQVLVDDGFGGKRIGYICPVCKEFVPNKGNYCLSCGAKMDEEEK